MLGLGGTQADLVDLDARLRTSPDRPRRPRLHRRPVRRPGLRHALQRGEAPGDQPGGDHLVASSGWCAPGDRIPSYRLSGDVTLPGLGPVAGLWREALGEAVEEALGTGLLVDLRSTMYAAFWRPPAELAPRVATVRVLHEADGVRKVVSHFNKATKGRIVRALLEDGGNPRTPAALATAAGRPGLDRRGRRRRPPAGPSSTSSSARSERGQRPDSAVRTRIRWHSSQRTTSSAGARADLAELGGVDGDVAAAALAGPQLGGADAVLRARSRS